MVVEATAEVEVASLKVKLVADELAIITDPSVSLHDDPFHATVVLANKTCVLSAIVEPVAKELVAWYSPVLPTLLNRSSPGCLPPTAKEIAITIKATTANGINQYNFFIIFFSPSLFIVI